MIHHDYLFQITRESIDILKEFFRDDMTKENWKLIVELKKLFEIMWFFLFFVEGCFLFKPCVSQPYFFGLGNYLKEQEKI